MFHFTLSHVLGKLSNVSFVGLSNDPLNVTEGMGELRLGQQEIEYSLKYCSICGVGNERHNIVL